MNQGQPDPLDVAVLAADERRAAEITDAFARESGDGVATLLIELVDLGAERALAVVAVLGRNLAATLVADYGRDEALAILERTRLDAAIAE